MRVAPTCALAAALGLAACGDEPRARDCTTLIWAQPSRRGAALAVIGSWNGWYLPGIPMQASSDPPWQVARVDAEVSPGEYGYLILEDGAHRRDPHNPLTTFWAEEDDLEVSLLVVPDCAAPTLSIAAAEARDDGTATVRAAFHAADDGAALARASASTPAGEAVPVTISDGELRVDRTGLPRGKHTLTLTAEDAAGRTASARASVFVRPAAATWADGLLYQVVTDRFRGDGGAPLAPPPTPGARAGGTLDGVTAEIEAGHLESLGVGALWISPVYVNPTEAREGRGDGRMYEGYHGYWPLDSRGVDPRIGGEAALERLMAAAHARGIRVLLDVVPNHIYEDNPRAAGDPSQFNRRDPPCVCGLDGCDWGAHIQTCWFTTYLPDLRFESPAVMRTAYEDLIWWARRFDGDGVRVDAVPMMPRAATRRMAHELRASVWPPESQFLIGEVYTGAGAWGVDVIRYYLGEGGLDSVFDFPLMWAIRDALAHESVGLDAVEAMLGEVERATEGSGAVLGRILGNHDTTRFLSEAHGDAAGDPWDDPPVQPDADARAFARHRAALTLLLTLPGLPVLYYGDELGLAGGNDPDNRRVLPAWDALSPEQAATLAHARRLGTLRACLPALRTGTRAPVQVEDDLYVFLRGEGEGAALVLLSRAGAPREVSVPGGLLPPGTWVDALSGEQVELDGQGGRVVLAPRSSRVLIAASSGCG
jgi:glycosidase